MRAARRAASLRPRGPLVRTAFRADRDRDLALREAAAAFPCRDIAPVDTVPHGQWERAFSDARTRAECGWVLIRVRAPFRAAEDRDFLDRAMRRLLSGGPGRRAGRAGRVTGAVN